MINIKGEKERRKYKDEYWNRYRWSNSRYRTIYI